MTDTTQLPVRIYFNERHRLLCKNYEQASDLISVILSDSRMNIIPDVIKKKYELAKNALSDWLDKNGYKFPKRIGYAPKDKNRSIEKIKGHEKA